MRKQASLNLNINTSKIADTNYYFEELSGCFCDPIITYPSAWKDAIPERLLKEVAPQRMIKLMECFKNGAELKEASDLEALIYLYPASLEFPLDSEWTEIYLYLATRFLGEETPEEIRVAELDQYKQMELKRLKEFIYERRVKERRKRKIKKEEFKKELDKFGLLQTKFNERGEIEFVESNLKGELGWKQLRLPFDF